MSARLVPVATSRSVICVQSRNVLARIACGAVLGFTAIQVASLAAAHTTEERWVVRAVNLTRQEKSAHSMQERFAAGAGAESAHTSQIEEAFLRWMLSQYGPGWHHRMTDGAIEAHWRRFLIRWHLGG